MNHMPSRVPVLPPDDPLREALHNEVPARPSAPIRLPALVAYVAVLNDGVTREVECQHLRRLPDQGALHLEDLQANFLRLRLGGHTLKWECHSKFMRYSIVQPLPECALPGAAEPDLLSSLDIDVEWLRSIRGRTVPAIRFSLVDSYLTDSQTALVVGNRWFGERTVVASQIGRNGYASVVTDFCLFGSGFERMPLIAPLGTSPTRVGCISQRLLEIKTYLLMAPRGLPIAKTLAMMLHEAEATPVGVTAKLEDASSSEQALFDTLTALAARVEHATAEHGLPLFEDAGLRRHRAPARRRVARSGAPRHADDWGIHAAAPVATVGATSQRLVSLSQSNGYAGALLRTRVDIATESQNQQLLAKLMLGQELQLRLPSLVEGLSIAAILYYMVSLLLYVRQAVKAASVPLNEDGCKRPGSARVVGRLVHDPTEPRGLYRAA